MIANSTTFSAPIAWSRLFGLTLLLALPTLLACASSDDADTNPPSKDGSSVQIPDDVFVDAAPSGAIDVRDAILSATPGKEIVVRAVVGGRKKAFVDGRAILVAADKRLVPCSSEEGCKTPWDYCCETKDTLTANTMTVQVVDADGAPLEASLQGARGLRELQTIVVAGSVRNAGGTLVLDAKQIHLVKD